jgi:hypothetical protein
MASETKSSMEKFVSLIASEIDGAKQLLKVAMDAYNTAADYQDTTAQKEAYARAKAAYTAAKEHLAKIEGLYKTAVDMMNTADQMRKEATEFAEKASKVDFTSIFEELEVLINDAINGGGDSALDTWLETIPSANGCSTRATKLS